MPPWILQTRRLSLLLKTWVSVVSLALIDIFTHTAQSVKIPWKLSPEWSGSSNALHGRQSHSPWRSITGCAYECPMAYTWPPARPTTPLAVLCSGGLDSAILLAEACRVYPAVVPIYVKVGTVWEATEQAYLARFLAAIRSATLQPLVTLDQPCQDLYASHWSMTGQGGPAAGDPEEDSYLPGRNQLLFTKPLLWCLQHGVPELATAPLASNPFPDASPEFYDGLARLAGLGVGAQVRILRPYAELGLHKDDVLRRGHGLPLEHTFSCNRPVRGLQCGTCSKCGERIQGFQAARLHDPTPYANR
jgi:7-cyano-7-deazaguanine synthase